MAEPSDEDLLEQFYAGNDEAFEVLKRRFEDRWHWVARTSLFYGGHRDAAERAWDIVQEAWLRVVRTRKGELSPWRRERDGVPQRVEPWLKSIIRNCITDYFRLETREPGAVPLSGWEAEEDTETLLAPSAETGGPVDPEELWACVEELPEDQRVVIKMKYLLGMSGDEVARKLKVSASTVSKRAHKALEALQERLRRVIDQ
jgi:RNA polymerase sigma-70 factor (ECF subfamily)